MAVKELVISLIVLHWDIYIWFWFIGHHAITSPHPVIIRHCLYFYICLSPEKGCDHKATISRNSEHGSSWKMWFFFFLPDHSFQWHDSNRYLVTQIKNSLILSAIHHSSDITFDPMLILNLMVYHYNHSPHSFAYTLNLFFPLLFEMLIYSLCTPTGVPFHWQDLKYHMCI